MKKLICMFLAFVLAAQVGYASVLQDITDNDYRDEIRLLYNLGIVKGYEDGSFEPDAEISRIEFLVILLRSIIKDEDAYAAVDDAYAFDDIPKSHWAYEEACFMRSMGMVDGVGDNLFGVDDPMEYNDAVKIIVSVLGFKEAAESEGGYPGGYIRTARSIGLLRNVRVKTVGPLTRAEASQIFAVSLEVGDRFNGTTLLDALGYEKRKGIVTSLYEIQLGAVLDDENHIEIDDKVYEMDIPLFSYGSYDLIGAEVEAYYCEKDDVIRHITVLSQQKSVRIPVRDMIAKPTLSEYSYYDASGRQKKVTLSHASVVYNGELLKSSDITDERLKPASGEVIILDSDNDGAYDLINIRAYENYVVKTVRDGIIYDVFGKNLDVRSGEHTHVYYNDIEVDIDFIEPGDVLSVLRSPYENRYNCYICRDSIEGSISVVKKPETETSYTIGGHDYYLGYAYRQAMESGNYQAKKLKPGYTGVFYLDLVGDVAFVADSDGVNRNDKSYGYLTEYKSDDASPFGEHGGYVTILTMNNLFEHFYIPANRLKFGRLNGNVYEYGNADSDEVLAKLKAVGATLVTYEAEGDTLTELCLPGSFGDGEYLSCDIAYDQSVDYNYKVVDGRYYLDENTACFSLPYLGKYKEYMKAGTYNNILTNNNTYVLYLYDIEPDGRVGAVIDYSSTLMRYSYANNQYETIVSPVNSPILFVNSVVEQLDDEGTPVRYAVGYQDGKETYVPIGDAVNKNSDDLSAVKPGAVIQYETNSIDRSRALTAEDDEHIVVLRKVIDLSEDNSGYGTKYGYADTLVALVSGITSTSRQGLVTSYTRISEINGAAIKLANGFTVTKNAGTVVMKYSKNNNEYSLATLDDLQVGMTVFCRRRNYNLVEIVFED